MHDPISFLFSFPLPVKLTLRSSDRTQE
uniref:Uncharacterized protein n=1 Tax=Arundo donax TaxID=35708 RepID=A0A0A9HPZ1_ARUDO